MWDRSEDKVRLALIRHGAVGANRERRYIGRSDESLSAEGIQELQSARSKDCYPPVDCLFSSPMKRCLETAGILYSNKKPKVIEDFREIDFGAFEGKNYRDLKDDKRYQEWVDSGGAMPFPEGESREEFLIRCERGFYRVLEELKNLQDRENRQEGKNLQDRECLQKLEGWQGWENLQDRKRPSHQPDIRPGRIMTVGLIVHGGVIMSLLSRFAGGNYFDYQVRNGEGYCCELLLGNGDIRITGLQKI